MKKTLTFGLIAATLGFSACSSEDDAILGEQTLQRGMVLKATVTQPAETRATIDDATDNWKFDFAQKDVVKVTNTAYSGYYTFTNDGTNFMSADAEPTAEAATWYAYFPSASVSLANQDGTLAGVANKFALAGATDPATTGEEDLSITMAAKVAILKINNQKGAINIQVKTSATDYVVGLKAKNGEAGFEVATSTTATSLFATTNLGTYYVAVPAGVKIAVKNGKGAVKSTGANGLTAGKYYELTIAGSGSTTGTAKANINGEEVDVPWVQLWAGGPKFATYNVGVTDANTKSYGGYYAWGGSQDKVDDHNTGSVKLTGTDDTATKLWGENWRMPTSAELYALIANCSSYWSDGVGVVFSGKGDYTTNSIVLSAGGSCSNGSVGGQNDFCTYWSSTPSGNDAYYLGSDPLAPHWGSEMNTVSSSGTRAHGYLVRAVLVEDGDDAPEVTSNLLSGKFSVGAGKQVQFTKGNLYWDGTSFKFEANQTDYPTTWDTKHVGHFYWTQTQAKSYVQYYSSDGTNTNSDVNFFAESNGGLIIEGTADLYALSQSEWKYLFEQRPNAEKLYKYGVTVGGQANCLIIAPDNFSGTLKDSYSLYDVKGYGFVCLPAAGYRNYNESISAFGKNIEEKGRGGYYLTTTPLMYGRAYLMKFDSSSVNTEFEVLRSTAQSLRLVCPVK